MVGKFRDEKNECDNIKKGSGAELYCPEDALSDNDDYDKSINNNSSQNGMLLICFYNLFNNKYIITIR